MEKFLKCENCKQVVARFDTEAVRIPIESNMFQPKHADRGQRPFWSVNLEARYMMCPICPKRVFNTAYPERLYCSDTIDGSKPGWFVPAGSQNHA